MNRCCLWINKHVRKDDPMYPHCQTAYFGEIEAKKKKKKELEQVDSEMIPSDPFLTPLCNLFPLSAIWLGNLLCMNRIQQR